MTRCNHCRLGGEDLEIEMAFQPIVDVEAGEVFAYEALVRGRNGEDAQTVLSRVDSGNGYAFDQQCRVAAIKGAVAAGILSTSAKLSINFLPNAVYSPLACIQLTLRTANEANLPTDRLIFEFTENEEMVDTDHVQMIVACYNEMGFGTAIDDFGAGYAGLNLLAKLNTDYLKLDMALIAGIDRSERNQKVVKGIVAIAESLGVAVLVEGIETVKEYNVLRAMGIRYMQGFLFAEPGFMTLPDIRLPKHAATLVA